jgi:hypothetical protein
VGEGRGEGAGAGVSNSCHPHPGPLPRPRERGHEAAATAKPPATTPALRAPHPPSPVAELRARLDLLLAGTAPVAPADADLAEAVCALRWPKWPDYRGALDLSEVRLALAGRSIEGRTLTRLGGAESGAAAAVPPPPSARSPGKRRPEAWPACRAALTPPPESDDSS